MAGGLKNINLSQYRGWMHTSSKAAMRSPRNLKEKN